jgi:Zn-dependent protease
MRPEERTAALDPPAARPAPATGPRARWSALGAGALAVALKGKALLGGLKLLSLGKVLLSAGSMLTMVWAYASRSGWPFAALFVGLLLVHELGHGWAIRKEGLRAGFPIFIPFLGAFISLKGQPRNSLVEARIALAGPVAGGAASLVCVAWYLVSRDRLWLAGAEAGFLLNLFNLTPLAPLDGGRVAQVFSRRAWIAGLAVVLGLCLVALSPPLLLIGALGLARVLRRAEAPSPQAEAEVSAGDRRGMATRYFVLLGGLAAGAWCASVILQG